ncbi:hypothetical protein [Aquidulcibacter paucihalophilus]|uniref:hypothetical protein n=1 Tax=Aquidulcibacter paucihalophilus TaxID=1978549 RepID=UPI0012FF7B4F|nr:hypothetical protein [Aquidulcibacter paucihalophilus]
MPIEATPAHIQNRRHLRRASRFVVLGLVAASLGACQSLSQQEGFLPDTIRSAGSVLTPRDYPDLTKIPDAPTNLPSQKSWAELQAGLQASANVLEANPSSKPVAANEIDQAWAKAEQQAIEANAASAPAQQNAAESDAWAAAARAKMEADIARLPPT